MFFNQQDLDDAIQDALDQREWEQNHSTYREPGSMNYPWATSWEKAEEIYCRESVSTVDFDEVRRLVQQGRIVFYPIQTIMGNIAYTRLRKKNRNAVDCTNFHFLPAKNVNPNARFNKVVRTIFIVGACFWIADWLAQSSSKWLPIMIPICFGSLILITAGALYTFVYKGYRDPYIVV